MNTGGPPTVQVMVMAVSVGGLVTLRFSTGPGATADKKKSHLVFTEQREQFQTKLTGKINGHCLGQNWWTVEIRWGYPCNTVVFSFIITTQYSKGVSSSMKNFTQECWSNSILSDSSLSHCQWLISQVREYACPSIAGPLGVITSIKFGTVKTFPHHNVMFSQVAENLLCTDIVKLLVWKVLPFLVAAQV